MRVHLQSVKFLWCSSVPNVSLFGTAQCRLIAAEHTAASDVTSGGVMPCLQGPALARC